MCYREPLVELRDDGRLRGLRDALASARTAALVDPEGESLAKCLAEIDGQPSFRIAAE